MPVIGNVGVERHGKHTYKPATKTAAARRTWVPPKPSPPEDTRSNVAKAWDFLTEPRRNIPTGQSILNVAENATREIKSIPSSLYHGAEALAGASPSGATPLEAGSAIAHQAAENWRHPAKYAYGHPVSFLSDLAAAGGIAYKGAELASTGLTKALETPLGTRLANEETGAIGPFGRRLEEGDIGYVQPSIGERAATYLNDPLNFTHNPYPEIGMGSSRPRWGSMVYPSGERYSALIKQDAFRTGGLGKERLEYSQGVGEQGANFINRIAGEPVRMPGSYHPVMLPDEIAGSRGDMIFPNRGAVIEDVPGLKDLYHTEDFQRNITAPEARNLSLFDMVTGNLDRAVGANMGYLPDAPRGQKLVAFDQGMSMPTGPNQVDYLSSAWQPSWLTRGENAALAPQEMDWLYNIVNYLEHNPGVMENLPGAEGVLQRATRLLQQGQFPNPEGLPDWVEGAWRNS